MAVFNVVVLPGIFGSRMVTAIGQTGFVRTIWISPFSALTGELIGLQLAADGVSPGPQGFACFPFGLIEEEYGILCNKLARPDRNFNVLRGYYDWRLSIQVSAAQVLAGIQANIGQQPFWMIGHSMGGLVARGIWKLLAAQGLDAQVSGIITLGTPHYGSWEVPRGFYGLPTLYQKLKFVAGAYGYLLPTWRPDFLDLILASWPGWYELMPWKDAGPAFINDPVTAAALYQKATYAAGNPYVTQARLDAAQATHVWLGQTFPTNRLWCLQGVGFVTAFDLIAGSDLSQVSSWAYGGGDSQVVTGADVLPGAPSWSLNVAHGDMPLDGRTQSDVINGLLGLTGQLGHGG